MKTIITLLAAIATLTGCSTTTIENATITEATFNSATWKSQAGITGGATIETVTAPKTDTSLTGL